MLRTMKPDDSVKLTLNGETHEYGPNDVTVSVVDTSTRGGVKHRYVTVTIALAGGEYPETTDHMQE